MGGSYAALRSAKPPVLAKQLEQARVPAAPYTKTRELIVLISLRCAEESFVWDRKPSLS